jgi:hypothetical protein
MNIIKKVKEAASGKRKEAASIGIIGFSEEQKEQYEEFKKRFEEKMDFCRKNAIPREKKISGIELKNHIIEEYGAVEKEFPESCFPPKKGGKETVLKWARHHDQNEIRKIARGIPDEQFGLQFSDLLISTIAFRVPIFDMIFRSSLDRGLLPSTIKMTRSARLKDSLLFSIPILSI